MPRSAGLLAFPDFRGFTRQLILWNLGAYFALLLLGIASASAAFGLVAWTALDPYAVLHFRANLAARNLQLCPSEHSEHCV